MVSNDLIVVWLHEAAAADLIFTPVLGAPLLLHRLDELSGSNIVLLGNDSIDSQLQEVQLDAMHVVD